MTSPFCVRRATGLIASVLIFLASCGGGGDGPAIQAQVQTIRFGTASVLRLSGSATVTATSTSGLVVSYSSLTTAICAINAATGQVSALAAGTCILAADQDGNDVYAPAAKVLLCEIPNAGQGFIALASIQTPSGVIRLASPRDDEEFAQILYSALRQADIEGLTEVVVTQPIGIGIAVAIRDRLVRAANEK